MAQTATIKIKIRRDTEANWRAINPILFQGEIGFATDAGYFVIGNGTQAFNNLSPIATNALSSSRFRSEQAFLLKSVFDADNDGVIDRAETIQITVRNTSPTILSKGKVVYLSGATGNRPNAYLADASGEATSSKTIGIVAENIQPNSDGLVTTVGTMHDLDTSAFADGVAVWLSADVAGELTSVPPVQPNHTVFIGYVARSHPNQGRLVLKIQNGYELNELHNVLLDNPANNEALVFETSSGLWKNKPVVGSQEIPFIPIPQVRIGNFDNTRKHSLLEVYIENHGKQSINDFSFHSMSPVLCLFRLKRRRKTKKQWDEYNQTYFYRTRPSKWVHPIMTNGGLMGMYTTKNGSVNVGGGDRSVVTEWNLTNVALDRKIQSVLDTFDPLMYFTVNPDQVTTPNDFPIYAPIDFNPVIRASGESKQKGKSVYFQFRIAVRINDKYIFGAPSQIVKAFPTLKNGEIIGISMSLKQSYTKW